MTAIAARLLADALADPTIGVAALAPTVPRVGTDAAPDVTTLTVYDETRTGWVARGQQPRDDVGTLLIPLPAVIVTTQAGDYDPALRPHPSGGTWVAGTVTCAIQIVVDSAALDDAATATETATEQALRAAGYLARAALGTLLLLQRDESHAARETTGFRLQTHQSVRLGAPLLDPQDTLVTATLVTTWAVAETTPVPLPL